MADKALDNSGASSIVLFDDYTEGPRIQKMSGGSGGGGGSTLDAVTQAYVDAKSESVKAANDARFAEVVSELKVLEAAVNGQPKPASIPAISGVVFAALATGIGVLAFASDRFDGGVAATSIVSEAVKEISLLQSARDDAQDATLNRILFAVEQNSSEIQDLIKVSGAGQE